MKPDSGGRPTAGDGGQEEQAGQQVELGEGRGRHQPVAGTAAAAGDEVGQQEQGRAGQGAVRHVVEGGRGARSR